MITMVLNHFLEPQTTSFNWMEVVISTHFSLSSNDLVHHPIDSQPFKKWLVVSSSRYIFIPCPYTYRIYLLGCPYTYKMRNEKNLVWLGYLGGYTTLCYRVYYIPL